MTTGTRMTIPTDTALLTLVQWLSPSFPIGGFAWSHGLETAIAIGAVSSAATLERWLAGILAEGSGRNDAILLAHVLNGGDADEADALARALAAAPEREAESLSHRTAFMATTGALTGAGGPALMLPVAVGLRARDLHLPAATVLQLYLQGFAANLVLAAVRLVPLGQTEGQKVLADLAPLVSRLSRELADAGPEDLGGGAFAADIAAMAHEHQDVRLFRS